MIRRANLYYDSEIDTIANARSLDLLPIVEHLFVQYPHAAMKDVFYTVSEHVKEHGTTSLPSGIIKEPVEEVIVEVKPEPVVAVVSPDINEEDFDILAGDIDDELAQPKKVRILKTRENERPVRDLNLRGIFEDIEGLNL